MHVTCSNRSRKPLAVCRLPASARVIRKAHQTRYCHVFRRVRPHG
jgi:hypothetical protein